MVSFPPVISHHMRSLLGPLLEQAEGCTDLIVTMAGTFQAHGSTFAIPRIVFTGPEAEHEPIRVGVFATLHGDEPAGAHAVCEFVSELVADPTIATGYDLVLYPVCNPYGFEKGTRANWSGLDLNREFWKGSELPEIRTLETELRAHSFQGIIALHSDDTCEGVYGYAHGRVINESLLQPALERAAALIPHDARDLIDGFPAAKGILRDCFRGVLSAPPDQRPQPFDLIFETPANHNLESQVDATLSVLHSVLRDYRRFIAYAQDL
ncbi:MAG: M14 family zinc carboxypeptidase [Opitutaceae bacterium]|nr:M14 family zinc carboxypeptidase [Opitutaceae bacterium]